jgi:drug/metabolite transporter (DMT)-like permease
LPALLAAHFSQDIYVIGFSAGVGGGFGWATVDLIYWVVRTRLGAAAPETGPEPEPEEAPSDAR